MTLLKFFFIPIFFASTLSHPPSIPNLNLAPDDVNKILQVLSQNADFLKLEKEEQTAVVNEYAEILLNNLNGFLKEKLTGPVPLPDIEKSIPLVGTLFLTNGILKDLNSLKRVEDVVVSYSYPNFKLHLPMSFTLLAFQYKYKLNRLWPWSDLQDTMYGTAKGTIYTLDIALDLTTLKAKLSDFKLNDIGEVNPHFEGSGLTVALMNTLIDVAVELVPGIVTKILDGVFADTLTEYIEKYNEILEKILGQSQFL